MWSRMLELLKHIYFAADIIERVDDEQYNIRLAFLKYDFEYAIMF
jgi:hypothetical protein